MNDQKEKSLNNIRLDSSQPIDDGGRKYNFIYLIAVIAGVVLFIPMMGVSFSALLFGGLLGAISAWVIKNIICRFKCYDLRTMTFAYDNAVPYAQLIQSLQPILLPLGMNIEISSQGYMVIKYKGVYYDVYYNNDHTFSIAWRMSVLGALITRNEYISQYRKACVAYGIIGYYVQNFCQWNSQNSGFDQNANINDYQNNTNMSNSQNMNNSNNVVQTPGTVETTKMRFCGQCGSEIVEGAAFCKQCGNRLM